MQPSELLKLIE